MDWMWLFEREDHSKRIFISFIECALRGNWVRCVLNIENRTYEVLRPLSGNDCFIDIVAPDGLRRSWQFPLGSYVSIEQSMLVFKDDGVDEIAVDDDVKLGKKLKPRSTL